MKVVYALLALAVLKCIVAYKVYHWVPVAELKRRARHSDKKAAALYKVAAYEASFDLLLWIVGIASFSGLVIWSARTKWWLAAIVIGITAGLAFWAKFSVDGWAGSFMAFFAPVHARFLSLIQPVVGRVAGWLPIAHSEAVHSRLYESKDLLELLRRQNRQDHNRIPEGDLTIAANALSFGDKSVVEIMTPRREVKMVGANETIGPLLMDELHKSGFSRFPVVKDTAKSASSDIVGTLYLNNLIGYEGGGKVKELARNEVYFINESNNLRQALNAFLKTHHHLLIVVNSFEEMVGVVSLEDVLEQILGKQIDDEFDSHDNLRAVAKAEAQPDQQKNKEIPNAPSDQ